MHLFGRGVRFGQLFFDLKGQQSFHSHGMQSVLASRRGTQGIAFSMNSAALA